MWLLHMKEEDKCKILQVRNGREYKLPERPHYNVDEYCAEARSLWIYGVLFHGCKCQPFRDIKTLYDDTLAERHEKQCLELNR